MISMFENNIEQLKNCIFARFEIKQLLFSKKKKKTFKYIVIIKWLRIFLTDKMQICMRIIVYRVNIS